MRKLTLAAALGGVLAVSAFAMPAFAQSGSYDPATNSAGPYAHGYTYSYGYNPNGGYTYMTNPAPAGVTTYTTPTYVAPGYAAPRYVAPSNTTTYTSQPYAYTAQPSYGYAAQPSYGYAAQPSYGYTTQPYGQTTQPYGQTTTTYTTASPGVTYAPVYQPSLATTVYVVPRACNPYDVARPGVNTACN